MDIPQQPRRPEDLIVDRYMPKASDTAREEARGSLRRLAAILMRIEDRVAQDWYEKQLREAGRGVVESEQDVSASL